MLRTEFQLLPQVSSRDFSIPVFIGYTEKASRNKPNDLHQVPVKISSLADYELNFGGADTRHKALSVSIDLTEVPVKISASIEKAKQSPYLMYHSLAMFFANGGQESVIISAGRYSGKQQIDANKLLDALNVFVQEQNASILSFPDAINLDSAEEYYRLVKASLEFCKANPPFFFVADLYPATGELSTDLSLLRNQATIGDAGLRKHGALYYPTLYFSHPLQYEDRNVPVIYTGKRKRKTSLEALKTSDPVYYSEAVGHIRNLGQLLSSAPALVAK